MCQWKNTTKCLRPVFPLLAHRRRVAKIGYPLFKGALQLVLLLMGFLELGEDSSQEIFKV
jgi:hypothetical protein